MDAVRDSYDSMCSALGNARGVREIVLALMESPDPIDHSLSALYTIVDAMVGDLENAKYGMAQSVRCNVVDVPVIRKAS
ncbi:MAG: hypothetical protein RSB04_07825 [Gordonibacter sp.]|uniref:hypothetical protein n=1 Tax=Gordonibacter sp. TaxID=1968902 RepID=UPI002FCC5BBA